VRGRVETAGMEVLLLDQTRPSVGVPVVRMVVPGLRSMRPRFAPGRLLDVPVGLGRLSSAPRPDALNPVPLFA
jgi:oxazoline/thiazoline synthase